MVTVISIKTDNPAKTYWVKRYSSGHYYLNQGILGKQFYKSWTRTTAAYARSIMKDFNGRLMPYSIMTIAK